MIKNVYMRGDILLKDKRTGEYILLMKVVYLRGCLNFKGFELIYIFDLEVLDSLNIGVI
jgi:hypothetical protein